MKRTIITAFLVGVVWLIGTYAAAMGAEADSPQLSGNDSQNTAVVRDPGMPRQQPGIAAGVTGLPANRDVITEPLPDEIYAPLLASRPLSNGSTVTDFRTRFPRSRAEFEAEFAPTQHYGNPFQEGLSKTLYTANGVIYIVMSTLMATENHFDKAVSHSLFPQQQPRQQYIESSFFGTPRFQSQVDTSKIVIGLVVPFGR